MSAGEPPAGFSFGFVTGSPFMSQGAGPDGRSGRRFRPTLAVISIRNPPPCDVLHAPFVLCLRTVLEFELTLRPDHELFKSRTESDVREN